MDKIKLGDLCKPSSGQIKEEADTLIDYIDISSVDNETKKVTGYQTIAFGESPSRARKPVKRGDVLVSTVRPNLNAVALLEEDTPNVSVASTGFCVLESKDDVDSRFIFNFCKSKPFIDDMVSQATGASYPAVSDKIVRSALVPKYTYQEQQHISTVLDKVAEIIDGRRKELQELDNLIKARFVEMFGSIKEEQSLGDISEFVTVGIANSATHAYAESGIPMLRNQNIKENYLDDTDLIYIKPEFAAKYESKKLKENDIIAMRTGYPGVACLVPKKYEGCQTFTTLIVRLKADNNPSYVCSYINSDLGKHFINAEKVGVAQQNVGAKSLAQMPIKIAPKELQERYADFVKQVDKSKVVALKAA